MLFGMPTGSLIVQCFRLGALKESSTVLLDVKSTKYSVSSFKKRMLR